jgi:hypothetical protein
MAQRSRLDAANAGLQKLGDSAVHLLVQQRLSMQAWTAGPYPRNCCKMCLLRAQRVPWSQELFLLRTVLHEQVREAASSCLRFPRVPRYK